MNYLEITGTLIGLVYLYLEYKADAWLWVASIAMPTAYLKVYYDAGLYADLGINIYYILASFYGLFCWLIIRRDKNSAGSETLKISYTPTTLYLPLTLAFSVIFIIIGYILHRFTDSTVPWADAFTTAMSIVAMWMLARKYIEQWFVWIVADVACVLLYVYKDLWFTGALYILYAVIAMFGYRKWKRMIETDNS